MLEILLYTISYVKEKIKTYLALMIKLQCMYLRPTTHGLRIWTFKVLSLLYVAQIYYLLLSEAHYGHFKCLRTNLPSSYLHFHVTVHDMTWWWTQNFTSGGGGLNPTIYLRVKRHGQPLINALVNCPKKNPKHVNYLVFLDGRSNGLECFFYIFKFVGWLQKQHVDRLQSVVDILLICQSKKPKKILKHWIFLNGKYDYP